MAVNFQSQSRDRDNAAVFGSVELSRAKLYRARLLHYPTREYRRVAVVFARAGSERYSLWDARTDFVKFTGVAIVEIKRYDSWAVTVRRHENTPLSICAVRMRFPNLIY